MTTNQHARLSTLLDADWTALALQMGVSTRRRWVHAFHPRFAPVAMIRYTSALYGAGWRRLAKLVSLLNFVTFGIEVPAQLRIGPGLIIAHTNGTILGAREIGSNVTIFQQVTLGAKVADFKYRPELRPLIEDGVTLTAGAKVIGPITVGRGSIVGANSVVLDDVPPWSLAIGIPAVPRPLSTKRKIASD